LRDIINLQATKFLDRGVFKYPCPDTNDVDSIDIAKNDHDRVVEIVGEVEQLLQLIFDNRRLELVLDILYCVSNYDIWFRRDHIMRILELYLLY